MELTGRTVVGEFTRWVEKMWGSRPAVKTGDCGICCCIGGGRADVAGVSGHCRTASRQLICRLFGFLV